MAVGRDGTAWVLYNDGRLYGVSTADASCTSTSLIPGQQGFKKFGLGFALNEPGGGAETLFAAGEFGLGSVDLTTWMVTPKGSFGFSASAKLTGNANGELYGLFYGFPPYVAQLDKESSALGNELELEGLDGGAGVAFAFWGGGFWVFTATGGMSSRVDRYDPKSKVMTNKVPSVGFKIVGAGVSTCAPVEEPK